MPRRPIVAAIGGNDLPDVARLAWDFGRLAASADVILLTGGDPTGDQRHVKNAAMNGCVQAHGRGISVLPDGERSCHLLPGQRRGVLQTGLTTFARDPITGAAADVVVVFRGGIGTLVELAYAALEKRQIVFCNSLEGLVLRDAADEQVPALRCKLDEAVAGYPLIAADPDALLDALIACFADRRRVEVGSAEKAVTAALGLTGGADLFGHTNFRGLPGDEESKREFERLVIALSML
jgi:uncharacterized protein (TIGR00725 family)